MSASRFSPLARLCVAAFLADMALYLAMTGAPYKALALGAGPLILGLLPMARALPYSLTTTWAGGLTEGTDRLRWGRYSLLAGAAAALALAFISGLGWLFAMLAVIGTALAFFWPAIQAGLADLAGRGRVTGNLGWFNIAWSSGKAAGFLVGGVLLAGFGFTALFTAAAVALLAVVGIVATLRLGGSRPGSAESIARAAGSAAEGAAERAAEPDPVDNAPARPRRSARFRMAAWLANAVSFGAVAVLNIHYPEWLGEIGRGETLFGAYLGLIFVAQTVVFALMARFPGWRYRVAPLLGAQLPLVLLMAALPWIRSPALILATAPLVGLGIGMAYFASLFYSVEDLARRGRNAGIHEAVLGAGTILMPLLGGWIAAETGRLETPYLFAAAVGMVSVGVQAVLLGGSVGRGNREHAASATGSNNDG